MHIFVVDPSEPVRDRLAESLGPQEPWTGHEDIPGLAQAIDRGMTPALALLGPGIPHDEAVWLAESVRDEGLPVSLVKVSKVVHADHLRSALRAGMEDVIEDELEVDRLAEVLIRGRTTALQKSAKPESTTVQQGPPPSIAVVAGKGGVGASLTAANLAVALADQGRRPILIDLDVRGGDVAIMFQHRPSLTLLDALERTEYLDLNAIQGYVAEVDGVLVLPAPMVGEDAFIDVTDWDAVLALAGQLGDIVIVDVGDTFRPVAQHVIGEADRVVVVTTPEVPSIRGTRRVLRDLSNRGYALDQVVVVANQVGLAGGLSMSDAAKALDIKVDAQVAWDKRATPSINQGEHLARMRRSRAGKGFVDLAQRLGDALGFED